MSAPVLNGPFVLPMFRSFVPRKMQPWIYLFIAAPSNFREVSIWVH